MQSLTDLCIEAVFNHGETLPDVSFPESTMNKFKILQRYDEMRRLINQRFVPDLTNIVRFINKKAQMLQLLEFDVFSHYEISKYEVIFKFGRPQAYDIPNGIFLIYYEFGFDCFGARAKKDDMYQAYIYCENKWHCTGGMGNWFPHN